MAKKDFKVEFVEDLKTIIPVLRADAPPWMTYDTESTGLHIKRDRPFLAAVRWHQKVFVFDATPENLHYLPQLASLVKRIYGHNMTYDMHMTANIKGDDFPLQITNYGDSMGLARLVFDAVSANDGGDMLSLKQIGKKYIDANSDRYEKAKDEWLKARESANSKLLTVMLKGAGYTRKAFDAAIKAEQPLPAEIEMIHKAWKHNCPKPTYKDVPRDIIVPYLATDVILTGELVMMAMPIIVKRGVVHIMQNENNLLPVMYDMERQGIKVDRVYLENSLARMTVYIKKLTKRMHELAGREFTVGQHSVIKDIYEERIGYRPASTDKQFIAQQIGEGDDLAVLIKKLRTAEKWRSTYIERILEISSHDGRFYTSFNQFGAVSGRLSGDAQQFPKDKLYTLEGDALNKAGQPVPESEILFNPRQAFKMRGYYLDFSQVELRVQAHYTLKYGGDVNLCRAYMPFKCVHYLTGEEYDFVSEEGRKRWSEVRAGAPDKHWEDQLKDNWSVWTNPDTGKPWVPTDVHSATTLRALEIMGYNPSEMDPAQIKWWRSKGKTFNFMRNYGGGDAMAAETLNIALEAAQAMNQGYSDSFPLVITYQKDVERTMRSDGFAENMSGRKYYLSDYRKFYKVANYLIQGSCADDLKEKMIKIWHWLREQGLKTRMVLCVHDEIQFAVPDNEDWCIPHIKAIMEYTPDILVPIVAEVEYTESTWNAKRKVAV
jgi:DNA polymerase-1